MSDWVTATLGISFIVSAHSFMGYALEHGDLAMVGSSFLTIISGAALLSSVAARYQYPPQPKP